MVVIPVCRFYDVVPEKGWANVMAELPQEFAGSAREDIEFKTEAEAYFKHKLLTGPARLRSSNRLQEIFTSTIDSVSEIGGFGLSVHEFKDDEVVVSAHYQPPTFSIHYYSRIYPILYSELRRLTKTGNAVIETLAPFDVFGVNEIDTSYGT